MSNRFVVDLGDLKLDAAAKRRISNALQTAALGELAKLDHVTDAPFAVFDPVRIRDPQWYGIWIRSLRDRAVLPELDVGLKEIGQFTQGH